MQEAFPYKGTLTKRGSKKSTFSFIQQERTYNRQSRDVAQLGSALPWGGRGRAFESRRSDQVKN